MPFVSQQQEKCTACNRTVYLTEKAIVEEKEQKKTYHKTCIRCAFDRCNKVLSLGEYSSIEGTFYCKPHFKQLFKTKGNYEEGFGLEKTPKSGAIPATNPSSFVPVTEDERRVEKKETSEATAAKIRKFREEGESERCYSCGKTVYFTEKIIVEEKDSKKPFHKSCLRCSEERCGKLLELGSYASIDGVIYCKPHYAQLFKSKGNYDESFGKEKSDKWKGSVVVSTNNQSFIPKTDEDQRTKSENKTSDATAAKLKKWREDAETETCSVCARPVFLAEKLVAEEKNVKKTYHNACFRCAQCEVKLDLRNYGSSSGKIYCLPHLKEVNALNARPNAVVGSSTSFIPSVGEDKVNQRGETPAHIAEKFKSLGSTAEKCRACEKSVYATEKIVVEELKNQLIYHKTCLRCSKCNIQVDMGNFGSMSGIIYCKVHLKQFGRPEQAKSENAYFVSPLARQSDYQLQHESQNEDGKQEESGYQSGGSQRNSNQSPVGTPKESPGQSPSNSRRQSGSYPDSVQEQTSSNQRNSFDEEEKKREESEEREKEQQREAQNIISTPEEAAEVAEDERRKRREEREKQREEEEKRFNEERAEREREREERRRRMAETSSTDDSSDVERRRKEREERRRQQEEEAQREEIEQQKKTEERRKRLEALKNQ